MEGVAERITLFRPDRVQSPVRFFYCLDCCFALSFFIVLLLVSFLFCPQGKELALITIEDWQGLGIDIGKVTDKEASQDRYGVWTQGPDQEGQAKTDAFMGKIWHGHPDRYGREVGGHGFLPSDKEQFYEFVTVMRDTFTCACESVEDVLDRTSDRGGSIELRPDQARTWFRDAGDPWGFTIKRRHIPSRQVGLGAGAGYECHLVNYVRELPPPDFLGRSLGSKERGFKVRFLAIFGGALHLKTCVKRRAELTLQFKNYLYLPSALPQVKFEVVSNEPLWGVLINY